MKDDAIEHRKAADAPGGCIRRCSYLGQISQSSGRRWHLDTGVWHRSVQQIVRQESPLTTSNIALPDGQEFVLEAKRIRSSEGGAPAAKQDNGPD